MRHHEKRVSRGALCIFPMDLSSIEEAKNSAHVVFLSWRHAPYKWASKIIGRLVDDPRLGFCDSGIICGLSQLPLSVAESDGETEGKSDRGSRAYISSRIGDETQVRYT